MTVCKLGRYDQIGGLSPFRICAFLLWPMALCVDRIGNAPKTRTTGRRWRRGFRVVLAATLTLLGLIIGFSFSMAIAATISARTYEEAEANAIGTELVRADLLPESDATKCEALGSTSNSGYCSIRRAIAATAGDQYQRLNYRPIFGRQSRPGNRAADTRDCAGSRGNERCPEFAGIYPGRVVEPDSARGVVAYGGDCHLLQLAGRLWRTQWKAEVRLLLVLRWSYRCRFC